MTAAGQYFAQRAWHVVDEVSSLVGDLAATRGEVTGPVRVGCYVGFSSTVLPPAVSFFAHAHPRAQIEVRVGADDTSCRPSTTAHWTSRCCMTCFCPQT